MKENPSDRTEPLEMKRPPTVAHYPKEDYASDVKVNIIFIIAVIFFVLGYFTGIN